MMTAPPQDKAKDRPLLTRAAQPGGEEIKVWAIRLTIAVLFFGTWKFVSAFGYVNPIFIGTPEGTLFALFAVLKDATIIQDFAYTSASTALGFLIGVSSGIAAAALLFRSHAAMKAIQPILTCANSLPRIALAPLFILWFGLGITSRVALVVSLVFFLMMRTTLAGLTQPNRDFEHLARSLGCNGLQQIVYFILPAAVPTIVAGLELSLIYSFLGSVAGEIAGGSYGVGVRITAFSNAFRIDDVFALLIILVVISTSAVQLLRYFTGKLTRWHAREQGDFAAS